MAFDKKEYDAEYHRRFIFQKKIPFNRNLPEDLEILAFLDRQPNAAGFMKELIRREMQKQKEAMMDPPTEPEPEP